MESAGSSCAGPKYEGRVEQSLCVARSRQIKPGKTEELTQQSAGGSEEVTTPTRRWAYSALSVYHTNQTPAHKPNLHKDTTLHPAKPKLHRVIAHVRHVYRDAPVCIWCLCVKPNPEAV